jgi:hypothetical protein
VTIAGVNIIIELNVFGGNLADMQIELSGIHNLTASDFDL